MPRNVLIITYYWPPGSSPGVQRWLKFSKYLREFGWEPHILTVKNGAYPSIDESLSDDIPEGLKVYKTKTIEPFRAYNLMSNKKGNTASVGMINRQDKKSLISKLALYLRANFFIPDARIGWKHFALKEALDIIKKNHIHAIVTTGPPHSTHLIGLNLKRKLNIPWLADLRDPWTNVYYNNSFPRSKKTKRKDSQLEDKVMATADAVSVVSNGLMSEFQNRARRIEIIYNGFDESDFAQEITLPQTDKFTISYIGNFKPNQNVEIFWQAVAELKEEIDGIGDKLLINLTGNIDAKVHAYIKKYDIESLVVINPFVPHMESVAVMRSSNLLLFIIPEVAGNKLIITGKLFEYLAARTPLISIGPIDGDAAELLNKAGRDKMIAYDQKKEIKEQIKSYYNLWLNNKKMGFKHPSGDTSEFSRYELTAKLSELLNKISHDDPKN